MVLFKVYFISSELLPCSNNVIFLSLSLSILMTIEKVCLVEETGCGVCKKEGSE